MRLGIWCAGLMALIGGAASAQSGEGSPAFDVASVKPAAPITGGRIMVRMSGGPGSQDPGQLTYTNVTLKNVLMNAFNVKGYQILESERYDIIAKIPKGATKEQFQLMLQSLLAERFKLKLHRESKDLPIYALVVGKSGVKMKESPKEDATADGAAPAPPPSSNAGFGQVKIGKDGMPQLPPGGRGGMMMMMNGSRMKMQASRQQAGQIAEMLGNQLGRPVVDQTGLTANYDYTLDYAPDESTRMPGMAGMAPPPADGGGGGVGGASSGPSDASGPSLMTALQEQLGLKLESKKGPIELLVIDTLDKVPSEN
jgi:uncharacterized protein (TIGR03435 family)